MPAWLNKPTAALVSLFQILLDCCVHNMWVTHSYNELITCTDHQYQQDHIRQTMHRWFHQCCHYIFNVSVLYEESEVPSEGIDKGHNSSESSNCNHLQNGIFRQPALSSESAHFDVEFDEHCPNQSYSKVSYSSTYLSIHLQGQQWVRRVLILFPSRYECIAPETIPTFQFCRDWRASIRWLLMWHRRKFSTMSCEGSSNSLPV